MKVHEWKPDIIAIWNINSDFAKNGRLFRKEGFSLADIYSDPSIPPIMRHAKYMLEEIIKEKSNGQITPIHLDGNNGMHVMECPSSFYFLLMLVVYIEESEKAKGMEPSYALDAILDKNLGIRKLKFDDILENEAPHIRSGSLAWHPIYATNYKLEYAIYNLIWTGILLRRVR